MNRALMLVGPLLALAACPQQRPLPGDQPIGAFAFRGRLVQSTCPADAGLDGTDKAEIFFQGAFSICTPGAETAACAERPGSTFFSHGEVDRPGTFDGQRVVIAPTSAPRAFTGCPKIDGGLTPCTAGLTEVFSIVLFSVSQTVSVGVPFRCDAGIPAANPDAGITLPAASSSGYDVVRACGELFEWVSVGEGCACARHPGLDAGTCTLVYQVFGERT